MEKLKTPQTWAHHAFFGGRIEPIKMGTYKASLYGYDLCSAYPAVAIDLPSMRGGKGQNHRPKNLSLSELRELIQSFSCLAMVRLKFDFGTFNKHVRHLFYPLPFRQEDGAVLFPQSDQDLAFAWDPPWWNERELHGHLGKFALPTAAQIRFKTPRL